MVIFAYIFQHLVRCHLVICCADAASMKFVGSFFNVRRLEPKRTQESDRRRQSEHRFYIWNVPIGSILTKTFERILSTRKSLLEQYTRTKIFLTISITSWSSSPPSFACSRVQSVSSILRRPSMTADQRSSARPSNKPVAIEVEIAVHVDHMRPVKPAVPSS